MMRSLTRRASPLGYAHLYHATSVRPMQLLLSAWPFVVWALPALVLISALAFLVRGDRRAAGHLLALLACFLIGALLMEFFTFMSARMAGPGRPQTTPALGNGTLALLHTLLNRSSVTAPPLSLPAVAVYAVGVAYFWLLVTWGLHLRGKKSGGGRKKPAAKGARKTARA